MKRSIVLILSFLFLGIAQIKALSISASVLVNVTCYGGSNGSISSTPSGGTAPYTYSWSPGGETTQTATGLAAGTYTVLVTDHLGLTASTSAMVTQPTTLSLTASAKYSAVCPGQSDSIFSAGTGGTTPYSYLWTGPFGDISCNTCQNTNVYPYGAAYMITAINDLNGCTASASVSITVHPFPYVTITGPINPIAPGRSDTLVAVGSGITSYLWSNSSTKSAIKVSPSVPTTYSVTVYNTYGCYDTAHYTIDTNSVGNGGSSTNAIRVVPSTTINMASYSTLDSVAWFSFIPTDSNAQIIANSAFLGMPVPHVHRLTLYNSSLTMIVDEPMPDITGANQIRIDISHLNIGSTYYVRAARTPAHANMAGCNPSAAGICNATKRWDFQLGIRTVPVFVPKDSGSERPSVSQLYYESRGQIADLNDIPRFDIKAYTNFAKPAVYASDSALSFVYSVVDSLSDTAQRVDMVLTGSSVQPSQPVFKMQEDSNAGYLNYFKGFIENGTSKIEGYSRLVYKNVYPNVDMQVYSNYVGTKLYFVCNPGGTGGSGGNPANIELQFKGATAVNVTGGGGLNVVTKLGTLSFAPGFAYTDSAGIVKAKSWQAYFVSVNSNTVKFNTGSFNSNEPLIIQVDRGHSLSNSNNNLEWCTFYGGLGSTLLLDVATDASGNAYVAGSTTATQFPVTNGYDTAYISGAKNNAVIAKFNNLDVVQWSTYYGGSVDDRAYSIVPDSYGNVYVTGYTYSPDFHTSQPPIGTYPNCCYYGVINNGNPSCDEADAFIVMLNSSGNFNPASNYVPWATYYGGCDGYGVKHGEVGLHLVLDKLHNLYVVGGHLEGIIKPTLPLINQAGAFNSDTGTGFILKFNVNVTTPTNFGKCEWATDIGGHNGSNFSSSNLQGCAVDTNNNFYVVGTVTESGYPIINPGANTTFDYSTNAGVVTKFHVNNSIDWSTYYGTDSLAITGVKAIATDLSGNAYITGQSSASILLVNPGWPYYNHIITSSAFIGMFTPSGSLYWSTYFGGSGNIAPQDIACDLNNYAIIVGYMPASCVIYPPTAPPGLYSAPLTGYQEAFIVAFNISKPTTLASYDTSNYIWGTAFGGSVMNWGFGDAINPVTNKLYIVGSTLSPGGSFPLDSGNGTPTFYGTNIGDNNLTSYGDGFIAQFGLDPLIAAGVNNTNTPQKTVKVYPNPSSENFTVELSVQKPQDIKFVLYNLLGTPVYSEIVHEPEGTIYKAISVSSLPNGNYILEVMEGTNISHAKITKLQ